MGRKIDLMGQRFGKWTIVCRGESPAGYEHQQHWLCRCDCGAEAVRRGSQLRYAEKNGKVQSCQRCGATRHGYTGTPTHRCWVQMRDRCRRPAHPMFDRYGGRGIAVCERWETFENFLADMGERPSRKHSLDRIDNEKGYGPDNCRWAISKVQNRNRVSNRLITYNGITQPIAAWAEQTGISHATISQRIKSLGWSAEDALTTPVGRRSKWKDLTHISS